MIIIYIYTSCDICCFMHKMSVSMEAGDGYPTSFLVGGFVSSLQLLFSLSPEIVRQMCCGVAKRNLECRCYSCCRNSCFVMLNSSVILLNATASIQIDTTLWPPPHSQIVGCLYNFIIRFAYMLWLHEFRARLVITV